MTGDRSLSSANVRHCPGIYVDELRKTNALGLSESIYEPGVLAPRPFLAISNGFYSSKLGGKVMLRVRLQ